MVRNGEIHKYTQDVHQGVRKIRFDVDIHSVIVLEASESNEIEAENIKYGESLLQGRGLTSTELDGH